MSGQGTYLGLYLLGFMGSVLERAKPCGENGLHTEISSDLAPLSGKEI
jgi:hypothetical protein